MEMIAIWIVVIAVIAAIVYYLWNMGTFDFNRDNKVDAQDAKQAVSNTAKVIRKTAQKVEKKTNTKPRKTRTTK